MKLGNLWKLAVIVLAVVLISAFTVQPLMNSLTLGLDLQGGTHVVLECQDTPERVVDNQAVKETMDVLQKRVNGLGLKEPVIQREGERRIIVELPGVKNAEEAVRLIGKTAYLEFKDPSGKTVLTGQDLKDAKGVMNQQSGPEVALEFSPEGAKKFADLTAKNVGKNIAILLDGQVLTAPTVKEPIPDGKAVITGSRSMDEAQGLAVLLKSGALPVKLNILEIRTVGPTLGEDSKEKSKTAFVIGVVAIVVFMLLFYRLSGLVASFALGIYAMLLLAALVLFHATLTLPGIAGFILSMGMAVDANVLIFERFKEEMRSGKTLRAALDAGFSRAFVAIFDSNVTTLIAAAVLFYFGTGGVKGFAITLSLGILISMFTAITITRYLLRLVVNSNITKNPKVYGARG